MNECRYCYAEITWGKEPLGRYVPLEEHADGSRVLDTAGCLGPSSAGGRRIDGTRYVRHTCKEYEQR